MRQPFAYVGESFEVLVDALGNIDGWTEAALVLRAPDGTQKSVKLEHEDGTAFLGIVLPEVFDAPGEWLSQLRLLFPNGPRLGKIVPLVIGEPLEPPADDEESEFFE